MTKLDCLIVGGGPAGLTAAIYAARFHLSVAVIDAGDSRAAQIPRTRNYPGFPDGISGPDLLDRMRAQATGAGAELVRGRVLELSGAAGDFMVATSVGERQARAVLMASGLANRRPAMDETLHADALSQGRLRYCPICDGFEVTDQDVALIGMGAHGAREAMFLRSYTERVSLISTDHVDGLGEDERARLIAAGIVLLEGPAQDFSLEAAGMALTCGAGRMRFEAIYPALGSSIHSELARRLGADCTKDGCIRVDAHQRTSVEGLYAAGDVVIGLDQISHAMGEAGVAATTIRNDLAARSPLLRTRA